MNQITVTEEKKMTVPQRLEKAPYEILADGNVIGVFRSPEQDNLLDKVTCPNCKFVVTVPHKDVSAPFSVQHP